MSKDTADARPLPAWFLGLPHTIGGAFLGYVFVAIPILLRARGVSVEEIAWITAVGGSPISWAFLLSPMVDAQFSRRTYVLALSCIAAVCVALALPLAGYPIALTAVLLVGETAAWLSAIACYAWQSEFVDAQRNPAMCGWSEMCGLGGGGLYSGIAIWIVRMGHRLAPLELAVALLLSVGAALWFPRNTQHVRTASHVFRTFFSDMGRIVKRRRCRYALLMFLVPEAAFSMPFSSVGSDFHLTEYAVNLITGPWSAVACGSGCLLGILLCRRLPSQLCYIVPGIASAVSVMVLAFLPKDGVGFTVVALFYVMMKGINFTAFATLALQLAGRANPLATTMIAMMAGISNISTIVMKAVDGRGYTLGGVNGMLIADGAVGLITGIPLLLFLMTRGTRMHTDIDVPAEVLLPPFVT
jgi:predicted MFS family arabinose efflux permease